MAVVLPVSLVAEDTSAAMFHSSGTGILINKNAAPASTALFLDDLIETPRNAAGRIELTGSTAEINAETMVQFEGTELVLDHGSLMVNTSRGLRVRVGCVTVTPVNAAEWTNYSVTDVDGKVTVSAIKSDVYIDAGPSKARPEKDSNKPTRDLVRQGEEKSRTEKCGAVFVPGENVAAIGAILNSVWVKAAGIAVIGGLMCFALCQSDSPASPYEPEQGYLKHVSPD